MQLHFRFVPVTLLVASAVLVQLTDAQPYSPPGLVDGAAAVSFGSVEWGDYNADTHMDIVITGRLEQVVGTFLPIFGAVYRTKRTDFNGLPPPPPLFEFIRGSLIDPVWLSDSSWEDIDGDRDLDLAIIGATILEAPYDPSGFIYQFHNEGAIGEFEKIFEFDGLHSGSVRWGDYDNDGDVDLLVTGVAGGVGLPATRLFRNDDLSFVEQEVPFSDIGYGEATFADIDGDFDLDVVLSGMKPDGLFVTEVFRNDGSGSFSLVTDQLPGTIYSSIAWADYDFDGDQDFVLSGGEWSPFAISGTTTIYVNDGSGQFTASATSLSDAYYGDVEWIDYERDGDLDLLVTGLTNPFGSYVARMFVNDGGNFTGTTLMTSGFGAEPVAGLAFSSFGWADYDEDGDLDLLISGEDREGISSTRLYPNINEDIPPNQTPNPPFNLTTVVTGNDVVFSWESGTDVETPTEGLSYNIAVGQLSETSFEIVAPNSLDTGRRQLVRQGNTGSNLGWKLENLAPGTYYWSVQSIDTDMAGSPFAAVQSFIIN